MVSHVSGYVREYLISARNAGVIGIHFNKKPNRGKPECYVMIRVWRFGLLQVDDGSVAKV